MSVTKADLQRAGAWLGRLRRVTAAGSEEVTKELLADYTGWLAQDFPRSVFTDASMKFIAEQSQYFPKWAVLVAGLQEYRDKHPDVPRLISPPSESLRRHISAINQDEEWQMEQRERRAADKASWQDPRVIARSVDAIQDLWAISSGLAQANARLLVAALTRHAPDNLAYLPPAWLSFSSVDDQPRRRADR